MCLVALVWPSMLLASHTVFLLEFPMDMPRMGFLRNARETGLHLVFSFSFFGFDCIRRLMIKLSFILDIIKDKQTGSSNCGSGILYQIVPSLPLGRTLGTIFFMAWQAFML